MKDVAVVGEPWEESRELRVSLEDDGGASLLLFCPLLELDLCWFAKLVSIDMLVPGTTGAGDFCINTARAEEVVPWKDFDRAHP